MHFYSRLIEYYEWFTQNLERLIVKSSPFYDYSLSNSVAVCRLNTCGAVL